jgi:hypothetical protein
MTLLLSLLLVLANDADTVSKSRVRAEFFPRADVRLLEGPFLEA